MFMAQGEILTIYKATPSLQASEPIPPPPPSLFPLLRMITTITCLADLASTGILSAWYLNHFRFSYHFGNCCTSIITRNALTVPPRFHDYTLLITLASEEILDQMSATIVKFIACSQEFYYTEDAPMGQKVDKLLFTKGSDFLLFLDGLFWMQHDVQCDVHAWPYWLTVKVRKSDADY